MYRMTGTQDVSLRHPVLNVAAGRWNCMFNKQEQSVLYKGSILLNLSRVMYRMTCTQDMSLRLPVLIGAAGRRNCKFHEQEQSGLYNGSIYI
jgi:hypothetical protein